MASATLRSIDEMLKRLYKDDQDVAQRLAEWEKQIEQIKIDHRQYEENEFGIICP